MKNKMLMAAVFAAMSSVFTGGMVSAQDTNTTYELG